MVCKDTKTPNFRCEFAGTSSQMPVILKSPNCVLTTLPMGSSSPKYFRAVDIVITISLALFNKVAGSPLIILKLKMEKKLLSDA